MATIGDVVDLSCRENPKGSDAEVTHPLDAGPFPTQPYTLANVLGEGKNRSTTKTPREIAAFVVLCASLALFATAFLI